ncbi:MAG: guanylate kinase [Lachnospiraceae bacterium]|nr:guanylate kinase [Lachnospiraceae bacterium]
MGYIYYLMGKSASGKDSIYRRLVSKTGLDRIVIYTTRPIRRGEQDGVDYHFTDEAEYERIRDLGKIIEERLYETAEGPWRYFTVDDGSFDTDADLLGIGTLESFLKLKDHFGKDRVCPIYIEVEDGERLSRALKRERSQKEPKYRELCRRFLSDSEDFSEEKLAAAGITKKFENDDLDRCLKEIQSCIAHGYQGK